MKTEELLNNFLNFWYPIIELIFFLSHNDYGDEVRMKTGFKISTRKIESDL